ncbi:MAG: citrate/2-methylcitrate synthase [Simkaniaceae bacterium]
MKRFRRVFVLLLFLAPFFAEGVETDIRQFGIVSARSVVDPEKGLLIYKKPLSELIDLDYPAFIDFVSGESLMGPPLEKAHLDEHLYALLKQIPRETDPMQVLLSLLPLVNVEGSLREQRDTLVAKAPLLLGAIVNHCRGGCVKKEVVGEDFIELILDSLNLELDAYAPFDLFFKTHTIHGKGNVSCFASLVTSSSHPKLNESLVAMAAALHGELHGGANRKVIEQLSEWQSDEPSEIWLTNWIADKLSSGKKLYGYGHGILQVPDPRAELLKEMARARFPENRFVKRALYLSQFAPSILADLKPRMRSKYYNVDAFSGPLLSEYIEPRFLTLLFFFSRMMGNMAEIIDNRVFYRPMDLSY